MSEDRFTQDKWARLRFLVVGRLLVEPPKRGELQNVLKKLSREVWRHPEGGQLVRFAVPTIERWYYEARSTNDPVSQLKRRVRKDSGLRRAISAGLKEVIRKQYGSHDGWAYRLHVENLEVEVKKDLRLGPMPSYATVHRYMKSQGMIRKKRPKGRKHTAGAERALDRLDRLEVRSYELEYVNALWHLDFHHGSRRVVLRDGRWVKPMLLGVIDDHSRLCCHLQWYLDEQAETLVHGVSQAIQKRALPRALMSDNGSAMRSAEFIRGLEALGIEHDPTLPYSPYQNAKQESFWAQVEGRLMAMLEGVEELTLEFLNEATQAWVERDYHRRDHSEIEMTPLRRYLDGKDVGRPSPSSEALRRAFRADATRIQRRSDGTISVKGVRFEVPSRFRHLRRLRVRYASWDLSTSDLVDERSDEVICALFPLDKAKNASGIRRCLVAPEADGAIPKSVGPRGSGIAPLLQALIEEQRATGLPPAYLSKPSDPDCGDSQDAEVEG
jgi:transposase InsO family protein